MSQVWNQLANSSTRGARAYAKKKSAMFKAMDVKARHLFSSAGYHHLLPSIGGDDGMILADILRQEQAHPENIVPLRLSFKVGLFIIDID